MFDDALTDIFNYCRELVATDMRMGIDKDGRIGSETDKLVENLTDISSLGRAGV